MKPMKFGVGQPVKRVEDIRLVTGRGAFASDYAPDGALQAIFLRSPHAHARFVIADTAAARAMPGVHAIYAASDFAELGELPCLAPVPNSDGSMSPWKPYPVIAEGEVFHVGDIVAMIVADTLAEARDASEAIAVDWEPLPAVAGSAKRMGPGGRLGRSRVLVGQVRHRDRRPVAEVTAFAENGSPPRFREQGPRMNDGSPAIDPESGDGPRFAELIRKVRAGDEDAATELVHTYEREVRREVRLRMRIRDSRLRRVFDSMDIVQSVLQSFFTRASSGQFDLDAPDQLRALLVTMARVKLAEQVRRQQRQRRDVRRVEGDMVDYQVDRGAGPIREVVGQDLLKVVRGRLSQEERQLADLRTDGRSWAEVAADLGGTPDGRRKQWARAIDRIVVELGLEGLDPST